MSITSCFILFSGICFTHVHFWTPQCYCFSSGGDDEIPSSQGDLFASQEAPKSSSGITRYFFMASLGRLIQHLVSILRIQIPVMNQNVIQHK